MSDGPEAGKQIQPNPGPQKLDLKQIAPLLGKKFSKAELEELQRLAAAAAPQATVQVSSTYTGPIPAPGDMRQFAAIIPDGANRILKMAEEQQSHRIQIEKQAVTEQFAQMKRGQYCGLAIAVFGLVVSGMLGMSGQQTAACVIGGTTLVSIVTVFVTGRMVGTQPKKQPTG